MKVYRGSAAAARNYVEADRTRADDYYLAEGAGVARRFTAGPDGPVAELAALSGDGYEAWVAGVDPDSSVPRGRLRADGSAVRFVEVVVNGPKSWSLAAELHPDVAAAYEAAQDRAAEQITGWLARHMTTRVGPRGAQVAVPVEKLEAVTVRHYTSRAGDPHRHLHLQVNARVFAAGRWRGIDTVAVRDSLAAVNGIGHAAVACDPAFRASLAAHGYTLTPDGEIAQLAPYVGPFSKRAAQIAASVDRYEAQWRREHPGQEPGRQVRRAWDVRAWAEDRPDKVVPRDGSELRERWLQELAGLGYRDRDTPLQLALALPGAVDRDAAAVEVVARLGAGRSAWNAADVRGQVEQLLARDGVIAEAAVRGELAEDLTARAVQLCVPLREDTAVPDHVRALTSRHVLAVEADLVTRLAARAATPSTAAALTPSPPDGLDVGQRAAVAALAGDAQLVVIEGAAGAGKTTTLAAVRADLTGQGRRLVIVTPTLKAAHAARSQVGAAAGSAAWLAWQYGWRWGDTGTWTRTASEPAPGAVLGRGDLLLVDEAGMLDQDTAHALLTIADETGARLALVGDRYQLPAVGRGGVLDLAQRWVDPSARVQLDTVHRFVHTIDGQTVPDADYARLSLAMRTGEDPGAVFDALHARGQIVIHACEADRRDALADTVAAARAAGVASVVVADTREHASALNTAIRDALVATGAVDDTRPVLARAGQRVGAGDLVVTRRNDPELGVANRDSWTVTTAHRDGGLTVADDAHGPRRLPADYVRTQVELGYAVTGYGAQGDTTRDAHLALTEATTAAAAYVAMTRGRHTNTAHLVADSLDDAREQWISAFARDRADHGPAAAAAAAHRAAAGYAPAKPVSEILAELRQAWTVQADAGAVLHKLRPLLEHALEIQPRVAAARAAERVAWAAHQDARGRLAAAREHLTSIEAAIDHDTTSGYEQLRAAWDAQRPDAYGDARRIQAGVGRFGRGRSEVAAATARLHAWAEQWLPILGELHLHRYGGLAGWAAGFVGGDYIRDALHDHAQRQAVAAHPGHADAHAAVTRADADASATLTTWSQRRDAFDSRDEQLTDPDTIGELRERISTAGHAHSDAEHRLVRLRHEPAVMSQPDPDTWLARQHGTWQRDRDDQQRTEALARAARERAEREAIFRSHDTWQPTPDISRGPSIGR